MNRTPWILGLLALILGVTSMALSGCDSLGSKEGEGGESSSVVAARDLWSA